MWMAQEITTTIITLDFYWGTLLDLYQGHLHWDYDAFTDSVAVINDT